MKLSLSIEFKWRDDPKPPEPEAGVDSLDATIIHRDGEPGELQKRPVGFGYWV